MAHSNDPSKYPLSLFRLIDAVSEKGEVFVPTEHPPSTRGYIQAFFRAIERANHPKSEQVKQLMVRMGKPDDPRGKGVIVCDRESSPVAVAIAAAIDGPSSSTIEKEMSEAQDRLISKVF